MEVETPFGTYQLNCFGAQVVLDSDRNNDNQYLKMNGIEFRGTMYFKYGIFATYEKGESLGVSVKEWRVDGMLYLHRKGSIGGGVTDNMRTKIYEELAPWVDTFMKTHPEMIIEGWKKWYESRVTLAVNAVVAACKVVDELRIKEYKAQDTLKEFLERNRAPEPDDLCKYITCGHIRQNHETKTEEGRYICNDHAHIETGRCLCMAFEE